MEAIPDYRTKDQIALDNLRSRVYSLGYTFTLTRRQGFTSHAELEADFTKEGYDKHFYGEAQGKNRMKAFIAAEIILITNFLTAIGEKVDFGESCIEEVDEIEPQYKVDRLTVLNTRHVKDIYRLLERDSEKYEALKTYQESLIKSGQRLNPKKAAEFLFPFRKANRVEVVESKDEPKPKESMTRTIGQMIAFEKWLKERGVTSLNYIEIMGKTIADKYPNFESLCKSASEDEINSALSNN